MEFAIPILAVGGWYLSCEQKKKETFQNTLVNHNTVNNYPTVNDDELKHTTQSYQGSGTVDKYFDSNSSQLNNNDTTSIDSLSGNTIQSNNFKHNNMVPFFGSKTRGNAFLKEQTSNTILDNYQGSGTNFITKREQAPLFKPEGGMDWANGMPNQNEFMRSRVNAPISMNNTKPWEEVRVGPGINKGFNDNNGSGGFNSGMENRESYMPKQVDELRTVNNPKISYSLENRQGHAQSTIKQQGYLGKIEKRSPDTFFENNPDRYFTTTGAEIKPTNRSKQIQPNIQRINEATNYMGGASTENKQTVSGEYLPPHKQQLPSQKMINTQIDKKGKIDDHGQSGVHYNTNNRSLIQSVREGNPIGLVDAMFAPVMDMLKPTKKTNFLGNVRPNGNIQNENGTYRAPTDRIAPTTKETTLYSPLTMGGMPNGVAASKHGTTMRPLDDLEDNQRTTTNHSIMGAPTSRVGNMTSYQSGYNMDIKNDKTQKGSMMQGGMNLFQGSIQQETNKQQLPNTRFERGFSSNVGPNMTTMGKMKTPQTYEQPNQSRMDPTLLAAFKNNPYTHSLSSAV